MIIDREELKGYLQDLLDELCSPRTSSETKTKALELLEKQVAVSCFTMDKTSESKEGWVHFLSLQHSFECNIPSRLLAWIPMSTSMLEQAIIKEDVLDERTLAQQLARALCIIQGIVLNHIPSKMFLSRKCSLEVLLELLLTSRHLTFASGENRTGSAHDKQLANVPLTSAVLDTLLCVLVDSPSALRTFESVHGIQAVVKILKRAGTPREVRMKCLEFLYFYLLDETSSPEVELQLRSISTSPTASIGSNTTSYPGTPYLQPSRSRLAKPSLNSSPLRPLSRPGSRSSVTSSSSSSRSTSNSSSYSFTSISSVSTPASSISSPEKSIKLQQLDSSLAPLSQMPPSAFKFPNPQPQRNTMMMLKKDVEFEPLSPRKPVHAERLNTPNSRPRAQTHGQLHTPSRSFGHTSRLSISSICENEIQSKMGGGGRKTTDEKKQLLGTMLGNVDALVEGVRKAGIWGLG